MTVVAGYKVLGPNDESHHGGEGTWTPGEWRSVHGEIVACRNGIHYCNRDQLIRWLGPTIWRFEDGSPDETVDAGDKMVTRQGRVVERLETWNDTTARLFAADCAETVVHLIPVSFRDSFTAAIEAARGFARGEVSGERMDAACAASWDAAWAAAWAASRAASRAAWWAASWDAAWAASRAASRDASRAAWWAASWDAAWAASRAASRDASRAAWWAASRAASWDAQTVILFDYLEGRRT